MELEAAVRMRPRSSRDCFSDSCRSLAENRRVVLSRYQLQAAAISCSRLWSRLASLLRGDDANADASAMLGSFRDRPALS